ncbi:MAG TPA: glycoside hydrolase family 15 protein [Polyangiaceae bacterium]|nr:glycoside hydrolase family 15 protein [Polyangiaceae bacterium]
MYQRIEDYGVIGNMRSVALVSVRGSIDWLCLPDFDSPSIFAALLDDARGGRFAIAPSAADVAYKQLYWPDTNVLITRFLSADGVGEIEDFMPCRADTRETVVRRVRVARGTLAFEASCEPAFDYARAATGTTIVPNGAVFHGAGQRLALSTEAPLAVTPRGVRAQFTLREGQQTTFVLQRMSCDACAPAPDSGEAQMLFEDTVRFWRSWLSRCTYRGRWREMVHRSALALKLLTFEPTGAIVAAPTCSLPERIGGVRNWGYRYTWVRDAAFTLYAFLRIGFTEEAARFMDWLEARSREALADRPLQIVYCVHGGADLAESTLDHLEGYRGSRPVRIGNGAYKQLQLDIYGDLMDSAYLYNKYGMPISSEMWTHLKRIVNWLCDNWRRDDEGIWETRGGQQQFVFSKLMAWVAVDRGIRLADKRSFPADRARWLAERDSIYSDIMTRGWSASRKAFVQTYGGTALDASNLLMPLVFFVSPVDPKMLDTLAAVMSPPREGGLLSDSLVYRYDTERPADGLPGQEGTFNMCTFWLVEALTRAGRADREKLEKARLLFERMLGYANHLGLYAEQTGNTGEALGNYPQALTHLALISAAYNLDRTLNEVR